MSNQIKAIVKAHNRDITRKDEIKLRKCWHWVGRIRGRDFIYGYNEIDQWISSKYLHQIATKNAKHLGEIQWTKSNPLFSAK